MEPDDIMILPPLFRRRRSISFIPETDESYEVPVICPECGDEGTANSNVLAHGGESLCSECMIPRVPKGLDCEDDVVIMPLSSLLDLIETGDIRVNGD